MEKTEREILMIPATDYEKVVENRRNSWVRRVLAYFGLSSDDIALAFSDDLRKWQEAADVAQVFVDLQPDQSVKVGNNVESFAWGPPMVVKQKVPNPSKRCVLFVWTEPK